MIETQNKSIDPQAEEDFNQARRRAFWRKLQALLRRNCNDLIPVERVLKSLLEQKHEPLGLQQVPLQKIVGSSGRYHNFDLGFNPLTPDRERRWRSIAAASHQGVSLPPPLLYKVGDVYLVEDGNHRLSVANFRGQDKIQAKVISIDPSVLREEPKCTRLGYKLPEDGPNS